MARVGAAITVDYESASQQPLLIESDGGLAVGGAYRLRLYPNVQAQVYTDRGSVRLTTEMRQEARLLEGVLFSGGTRARPKVPVYEALGVQFPDQLTTLVTGEGFVAADIDSSDFYLDTVSGEIVAPVPLWGPIQFSYLAQYRIIEYRPAISTTLGDQSVIFQTGTVYAHYEGQTAEYEIELVPAARVDRAELGVAISQVVADGSLQAWELPPDWPDDGRYPQGVSDNDFPSPSQSATFERVHAVIWYNNIGSWTIEASTKKNLKPYKFSSTYHPLIYAVFSSEPEPGLERGFVRAIADKDLILESLDERYENFDGERAE